jgi:5-formyltetrahydrofolate cyclo-ligase
MGEAKTSSEAKAQLRLRVRLRLEQMDPNTRAVGSALARTLLKTQQLWKTAQSVLFFAPLPGELDVWPLLTEAMAEGKRASLPRWNPATDSYIVCQLESLSNDLESGRFGIREPKARCLEIALNRLDLILVPAVAFDLHGRRLGRGKGFYDRLLAVARGLTCGVAYDEQIVSDIPVEPHDVPVNCILTPTRWIAL